MHDPVAEFALLLLGKGFVGGVGVGELGVTAVVGDFARGQQGGFLRHASMSPSVCQKIVLRRSPARALLAGSR